MAEIHNELKWSFSRMKTFDSCRRQYYLRHYLFWDGWKKDAPEDRRTAYRLSKMTSLAMFAGNVVHSRVADAFKRYRFNRTRTTLNELIETARLDWERGIAESESGKWRTHPKQYCCIFEHYCGLPGWKERAGEMWERIETSLRCFDSSGTWDDLRKTPPRKWLAYDGDPFEAVLVDGIPMFGRPDLAYDASKPENPNSRCWIFEFKTGRPRDGDVLQVRYYALVAAADWGFDPLSVKARLVYLHPSSPIPSATSHSTSARFPRLSAATSARAVSIRRCAKAAARKPHAPLPRPSMKTISTRLSERPVGSDAV